MTAPAAAFEPLETSLFPACVLPGCRELVDEPGEACDACRALWGPYLLRRGDRSPWHPTRLPACGHG